jgi:hypothetical protein
MKTKSDSDLTVIAANGDGVAVSTLKAFFEVNKDGIGPKERAAIRKAVKSGETYTGGGGAAAVFSVKAVGERSDVAKAFVAKLDLGTLMYAADPARGADRGFAAVGELLDHNALAVSVGCPAPNGTQKRLDVMGEVFAAITEAMIARFTQVARADEFAGAAREVLANWTTGRLAPAVNKLGDVLDAYDAQTA